MMLLGYWVQKAYENWKQKVSVFKHKKTKSTCPQGFFRVTCTHKKAKNIEMNVERFLISFRVRWTSLYMYVCKWFSLLHFNGSFLC